MLGMHRHRLRLRLQRILQLVSTALVNGYVAGFQKGTIYAGSGKAICLPVLNCYSCPGAVGSCPIGSLQAVLAGRRFPFYVLGSLMLFGLLLGRGICGLLCPFGFLQDLLHKLPVKKLRVPEMLDRHARCLKYVILVVFVLLLPAFFDFGTGVYAPYFCKFICPAGTLEGGIVLLSANKALRGLAGALFHWKLLVLAAIVILSAMITRPFCKYLCPLGAFYALFQRYALLQLSVDKSFCTGCRSCERVCPMQVKVTENINDRECIRCGKCREVCPEGCISVMRPARACKDYAGSKTQEN